MPATAELAFTVGTDDTAAALGSGDLPVLATPRLLAWCEAATIAVAAGALGPDGEHRSSVGTRVQLEHLVATGVGGTVRVMATLEASDGRLLKFSVVALDAQERCVATAEITRVLVDADRFLARVKPAQH